MTEIETEAPKITTLSLPGQAPQEFVNVRMVALLSDDGMSVVGDQNISAATVRTLGERLHEVSHVMVESPERFVPSDDDPGWRDTLVLDFADEAAVYVDPTTKAVTWESGEETPGTLIGFAMNRPRAATLAPTIAHTLEHVLAVVLADGDLSFLVGHRPVWIADGRIDVDAHRITQVKVVRTLHGL